MDGQPITGSCLCGEIAFEISAIEQCTSHCHCRMCRKFHGAAFATFGIAKTENFTWLKGKQLLSSFKASNGTTRQFCQQCGSSLTFSSSKEDDEVVEFALGVLDADVDFEPDAHIYTNYKANWFEITDDLAQYGESSEE